MAPLFILTETSAGYALLKSSDKKLHERTDLGSKDAAGICELLRLKKFEKFDSAATALEEVSSIVDGKVSGKLASLLNTLKKEDGKVRLAVADQKLGTAITKLPKLEIDLLSERSSRDIYRAIRTHLSSLIPALLPDDVKTMSLGLSHSLSRHKLKFSPDKIDTMIIQAIALLDDLDKELNMYAMRVKEWYGWHFPEMAKIINDNTAYARVIIKMGLRSNAANTDLADILPEEIETAIKAAAEISMGTDITDEDLDHIRALAEQVVEFNEFRAQLSSYLTSRMQAIAPNLTVLVGELVGARLIAHAGSLMQLAKNPASTIQLLGAEKALFRALKTKHDTPKYGLIYHASLVGQASTKNKGKIARMLGNKASLGIRIDSLAEWGTAGEGTVEEPTEEEKMAHGLASRAQIERRLRALEGKPLLARSAGVAPTSQLTQPAKFEIKEARKYNPDADGISANAAPQTNGTSSKPKLVQEVEEDDDEDEDSDEEMADANGATNGVGGSSKAERKAERARLREEKAKRKAERAAKREAKEKKKSKKSQHSDDESGKKRKRESIGEAVDEVKGEKKKKKKHSS